MKNLKFTAGNKGGRVRSDCYVTFEPKESGGISINLQSKVGVMYGDAIKELCRKELDFFGIKNALITIEDSGALDFTIAARIESVVRQATGTEKEFLLDMLDANKYQTLRDRFRFSRLYLPGNTPSMMINAGIHQPNGIILDLEDSVAHVKKSEAQLLIRNALRAVNFYKAERMVRINQLPNGLDDIKFVVRHYVNLLLIPKCESSKQIKQVDDAVEAERKKHGFKYPVYYMPIIESALGVEKAFEIATASDNVVAVAIGLEDFTADLGVRRTKEGKESLYARTRLVNACKAAGVQAIDSVFSDVADEEGLCLNVQTSKALGFEGMGCIHPRQINPIHKNFAPEKDQIERAKKIIIAFEDAKEKGLGVISIGTKMIDPPVVKRAETTVKLAVKLGLLNSNWIEEE